MKIVISGGGTAGHVYPAIALASGLSSRPEAPDVLYIGTAHGVESRLAREAGLRFVAVSARGVDRSIKGLTAAVPLTRGFGQSLRTLRAEKPDVVVGMGGFVSAPVVGAAKVSRIPIVLHEQNAVPGLVNRAFGRWARTICVTFEESRTPLGHGRTVVTGNPVRAAMLHPPGREEACRAFGLAVDRPVLLVFGGSRGAQRINKALVEAYGLWPASVDGLQILHVAGRVEHEQTQEALASAGPSGAGVSHTVVPYVDSMEAAYACATLVLARAGATTIAEIAICGVPSLLVPYPYATEDHQRHNARALAAAGASELIDDSELDGPRVVEAVCGLLERPERLRAMGQAAHGWARPDAADALAEQVMLVAMRR